MEVWVDIHMLKEWKGAFKIEAPMEAKFYKNLEVIRLIRGTVRGWSLQCLKENNDFNS